MPHSRIPADKLCNKVIVWVWWVWMHVERLVSNRSTITRSRGYNSSNTSFSLAGTFFLPQTEEPTTATIFPEKQMLTISFTISQLFLAWRQAQLGHKKQDRIRLFLNLINFVILSQALHQNHSRHALLWTRSPKCYSYKGELENTFHLNHVTFPMKRKWDSEMLLFW